MSENFISKIRSDQALYKQLLRFVVAGGLSATLEFASLIVLVEKFGAFYLTANIMSFALANVLNYLLSRNWVFIKGKHSTRIEFLSFFLVVTVGLLLNQAVMWALVEKFAMDYKISKIFAIGIAVIWNFFAKKFLVFKG